METESLSHGKKKKFEVSMLTKEDVLLTELTPCIDRDLRLLLTLLSILHLAFERDYFRSFPMLWNVPLLQVFVFSTEYIVYDCVLLVAIETREQWLAYASKRMFFFAFQALRTVVAMFGWAFLVHNGVALHTNIYPICTLLNIYLDSLIYIRRKNNLSYLNDLKMVYHSEKKSV